MLTIIVIGSFIGLLLVVGWIYLMEFLSGFRKFHKASTTFKQLFLGKLDGAEIKCYPKIMDIIIVLGILFIFGFVGGMLTLVFSSYY